MWSQIEQAVAWQVANAAGGAHPMIRELGGAVQRQEIAAAGHRVDVPAWGDAIAITPIMAHRSDHFLRQVPDKFSRAGVIASLVCRPHHRVDQEEVGGLEVVDMGNRLPHLRAVL